MHQKMKRLKMPIRLNMVAIGDIYKMEQKDLISIILPIYNVATYIDRCLESVVKQTYKNIEIILINDGSTDNSKSLCIKWTNKDTRIQYIEKKNGGVCSARNAGLKIAKGKFISFIDPDDYVSLNIIEHLYSLMIKGNCDLSICGRIEVINGKERTYPNKGIHYFFKGKIDMNYISNAYDIGVSYSKLISKDLLKNGEFPEGMIAAEDLYFAPYYISRSQKAVYTSEGLYYYYFTRPDSASHQVTDQSLSDNIKGHLKFYQYMKHRRAKGEYVYFNMIYNAYITAIRESKNMKKHFKKQYNIFFFNNFTKCILKPKCILFLLSPHIYHIIKQINKR